LVAAGRWAAVAAVILVAGLSGTRLFGYEYRIAILVDDEDDINEWLFSGDNTEEEKDTLIDLFRNPLELNSASRESLYNLPGLTYAMVDAILERRDDEPFSRISQLKKIEGITAHIYSQVKTFVRVAPRRKKKAEGKKWKMRGSVRGKVADRIRDKGTSAQSKADEDYPEAYLRARAKVPGVFDVGAAVVAHNTVGRISSLGSNLEVVPSIVDKDGLVKNDYDLDKYYYLKTSGKTYLPSWPKVYGSFNLGKVKALAGSYRVGFGQRLIFDSTGRKNPYGFAPDVYVSEGEYGFNMYKGQFGAVATLPLVDVGKVSLEATPFFSWWRYNSGQYDLKHRVDGMCMNSDNQTKGELGGERCLESYAVLVPYEGSSDYEARSWQPLPYAYSEMIGGANVSVLFGDRSHVGLTAYGSMLDFHFGDPDATFPGSTGFPERKLYYAGGLDFALSLGELAWYGEAGMMDNLAFAGLTRAVWEVGDFTLEGLYRYYQEEYDNPHSRAYAMSDEFEGDRRRGETGGMLSVRYRPLKWLSVRLDGDVWRTPVWEHKGDMKKNTNLNRVHPWRADAYLRVDTMPLDKLRLGVFAQLVDRDLSESGRDEEYYGSGDEPPRGEKYQGGIQASTTLIPNLQFWVYYKAAGMDAALDDPLDPTSTGGMEMEHYGVAKLRARPLAFVHKKMSSWLVVDARVKYFEGGFESEEFGEQTDEESTAERYVEGYVQMGTTIAKKYHVAVRGALRDHHEKADRKGNLTEKATEYFYKAVLEWKF